MKFNSHQKFFVFFLSSQAVTVQYRKARTFTTKIMNNCDTIVKIYNIAITVQKMTLLNCIFSKYTFRSSAKNVLDIFKRAVSKIAKMAQP